MSREINTNQDFVNNFLGEKVCELEEHVGILAHKVKILEDKVNVCDKEKLNFHKMKKKINVCENFTFLRLDYFKDLKPKLT